MIVFTVDVDKDNLWRWTLWQESHIRIAVAATGYADITECVAAIKLMKQSVPIAEVYDVSSGDERYLGV